LFEGVGGREERGEVPGAGSREIYCTAVCCPDEGKHSTGEGKHSTQGKHSTEVNTVLNIYKYIKYLCEFKFAV
jgi:hypothetical protein